jgi:hypothetical protein
VRSTGQKQPEGDLVVLLTDVGNEPNWFGGISPSMKIICSDFQLGILFLALALILGFHSIPSDCLGNELYVPSKESFMKNIHDTPIGCIMDFCQDKTQIILKNANR